MANAISFLFRYNLFSENNFYIQSKDFVNMVIRKLCNLCNRQLLNGLHKAWATVCGPQYESIIIIIEKTAEMRFLLMCSST